MGRLYKGNLHTEYENLGQIQSYNKIHATPLLQKNYGKKNDCTLTCMASIFGVENYDLIESIAEKHCYNGDKHGTNPLTIKSIMKQVMKELGVTGTAKSAYVWNFEKAKKLIDGSHQVILNLWKDGRDYYKNHSVSIIGYEEYPSNRFLMIYDNWASTPSYIDYDLLSNISSLNWYEE